MHADRRAALAGLPVRHVVPALLRALDERGVAVLAAPPGTGKTTYVPLALAGLIEDAKPQAGRVVVLEPRRLAARAAARRMAWLLGEKVGGRVGLTIRGERRRGEAVEVLTTGVLLQWLQDDPELDGIGTVILDECHERHLDADTTLAFLLDVRATLRPDLRIVAASATADTGPWADLLGREDGTPAPVVEAEAVLHPVDVVWAPPERPVRPPHGMRVDPALLAHVAGTVRRALDERGGDVLCFLPGVGEIARVAGMLGGLGADVLQVHGQAPAAVQDAVLAPAGGRRRVVLATSVAESSLTVPGVRIVVDAGLVREPRTDHARGLGALVTVRVSRAAADQRAGREAPGAVYRCWTQAEQDRLAARPRPEIELADLTAFALQAACWGDPSASGLALLDPPPEAALSAARATLTALGATDADGRVTDRGGRLAGVGVHPRLARALLDGASAVGARPAAQVVALLSEPPPPGASDDLTAVWRRLRREGPPADAHAARWREEAQRLQRAVQPPEAAPRANPRVQGDDSVAGLVVGLAFPERVARRRGSGYLMASGTGADLLDASALSAARAEWLAVAVADRPAGAASARVRQAVVIDEDIARKAAGPLLRAGEEVAWRDGDVVARRVERLGAIELAARPLRDPDPDLLRAALQEGLRTEGAALLRWSEAANALRERLAFLHRELGEPWPAMDDAALAEQAGAWIAASGARRRADLAKIDVVAALRGSLPWECAARLDDLAPERVEVPSGSRVRVDYSGDHPVLAVKLQELVGWDEAPRIAGGRVPLVVHLLSPAGRPAAVTSDLASFWRDGYKAVRAELRGRYPRHPWPDDPTQAAPTRRANPRR
ncbi:ATP-dependent helicase HrpB [Actinomadura rupiterrae]|uniref:ATP-dependent helicase HrpB n=1 Tax=Actinomadura rupiterrae TaxID=559627 RepID=UPI0020A48026|nr:ATP-dependent helicase HrpB [Actinomadura rupiterrae]MCP2339487.1 ATP-dependent helicase HrpB [Actinomadura rupiterrae]